MSWLVSSVKGRVPADMPRRVERTGGAPPKKRQATRRRDLASRVFADIANERISTGRLFIWNVR